MSALTAVAAPRGKVLASPDEAAAKVRDGDVVMFGGFGGPGFPFALRNALGRAGRRELTTVGNNTDFGVLAESGALRRVICSFPTGASAGPVLQGIEDGSIELELVPQGTLVERIHAGGAGLGGFLTPTGLGTDFGRGDVVSFGGKDYLLVPPLRADVAFLRAAVSDTFGNLVFRGAARNFNPVMAMAAAVTVVEVDEIVEVGSLHPDTVHTPGVFVDYIVKTQ